MTHGSLQLTCMGLGLTMAQSMLGQLIACCMLALLVLAWQLTIHPYSYVFR